MTALDGFLIHGTLWTKKAGFPLRYRFETSTAFLFVKCRTYYRNSICHNNNFENAEYRFLFVVYLTFLRYLLFEVKKNLCSEKHPPHTYHKPHHITRHIFFLSGNGGPKTGKFTCGISSITSPPFPTILVVLLKCTAKNESMEHHHWMGYCRFSSKACCRK